MSLSPICPDCAREFRSVQSRISHQRWCGVARTPVLDRFWAKVDKNGPVPESRPDLGPCWLWTGSLQTADYGSFYTATGTVLAHRFSWQLEHGPIPIDREYDHLCRVHPCVRPSHGELVTSAENTRRGLAGARELARTHCPHGHPYSPENTYVNQGRRNCVTCRRERQAAA